MDTNQPQKPLPADTIPIPIKTLPKRPKKPPILKFATFLMVMGIICTVFSIISYFSLVVALAYYLIMGCIMIMTLGLIMLNDGFRDFFFSGSDIVSGISLFLNRLAPYAIIISMAILFLSGLIAVLNHKKHSSWRAILITNIIFMLVSIAMLIIWVGFLADVMAQF